MKSQKVATYGLFVALAFILSYIESLIPIPVPIPGIKMGLANLVVIAGLYIMGPKEAFSLSIIRIILIGFTFGNLSTMIYSLAGGLLSCILMIFISKFKIFSITGVSIIGGVSHNMGQILVAMVVVQSSFLFYYLPFLLIAGTISGTVIGIIGANIVERIKRFRV